MVTTPDNIGPFNLSMVNYAVTHYGMLQWLIAFAVLVGLTVMLWFYDQLFADISVMPFGVIGFFGNQGRGKTFTAVSYARRWRHKNPNQPVYTNMYKLVLPGKAPTYLNCDLKKMMEARDSLILIDEAGVFINAWKWGGGDQQLFATWVTSTRHMGNLIMCTAHAPEQLNVRIQSVMAEFFFMERFIGWFVRLLPPFLGYFRATVYESQYGVRRSKATKTMWVPFLPSVKNSYDTFMLRSRFEAMQSGNKEVTEEEDPELSTPEELAADERLLLKVAERRPDLLLPKKTRAEMTKTERTRAERRAARIAELEREHNGHSHDPAEPDYDPLCALPRVLARHPLAFEDIVA